MGRGTWGDALPQLRARHPLCDQRFGAKFGETKDEYGDPLIIILCDYPDSDSIIQGVEDYAVAAESEGFLVTPLDVGTDTPAYECTIQISEARNLLLQVAYGGYDTDGDGEAEDYLGIFCSTYYIVDPKSWPQTLIDEVIGKDLDIPSYEGQGITYDSHERTDEEFGNYVSITLYGVVKDDIENYRTILEAHGYIVTWHESDASVSGEDSYAYYLAWRDETHFIQFNYGYDGRNALDYMDINIAKGDIHDHFTEVD